MQLEVKLIPWNFSIHSEPKRLISRDKTRRNSMVDLGEG